MIARAVASFGGVGFFPVAPGTAGSLVAVLLGAALCHGPGWLLPSMIVAVTAAGLLAIPRAVARDQDPGWVVIDEVAGQWIALLGLGTATPLGLLAAFLLFRLLDVTKPGPIGWADRRHGAVGIMLDDIVAGAIAALLLMALRWAELRWTGFGRPL